MRKLDQQFGRWLRKRHIRAFYISVADANIRGGTQSLLQVCGLGHLKPNVILLGFKSNWCQHGTALEALLDISDYFDTIQDAFNMNMAVCVFRDGNLGFDFTEAMKRLNVGDVELLQANLEESEGKKE
ncbi:unnamed protein product [Cylicostephanus goldi]|uniref:SLC12A transporter C-terminal domain-containing protein n=1 Tax=Cylicostephanus goldi TaxID=71465 RepID=A0A3P6RJU2_CYLGO|nr:unnamed protein product [Cylicostephanus goldi]